MSMVIHINGFPGVGKLTVAQVLAERLKARLIDNHSLINAATLVWPHGSDEYIALLARIAREVYADLALRPRGEVQIFTNALAIEYKPDPQRLQAIADLAAQRNVPFVQILLDCDPAENRRRVQVEERGLKGKLRDPELLAISRAKYTILHPVHENALRIDVTNLKAEEAAGRIVDFLVEKKLLRDL